MPRPLVVERGGERSSFLLRRLRREALYGSRERLVLDPASRRCERAELTHDGALLLRSGMVATGYFNGAGRQVSRAELVGVGPDGRALPRQPSTLGAPQSLIEASPTELLDVAVSAAYLLEPDAVAPSLAEALRGGQIFRCAFAYSSGFHVQSAFLVANEYGLFLLVGDIAEAPWSDAEATEADEGAPLDADAPDLRMF